MTETATESPPGGTRAAPAHPEADRAMRGDLDAMAAVMGAAMAEAEKYEPPKREGPPSSALLYLIAEKTSTGEWSVAGGAELLRGRGFDLPEDVRALHAAHASALRRQPSSSQRRARPAARQLRQSQTARRSHRSNAPPSGGSDDASGEGDPEGHRVEHRHSELLPAAKYLLCTLEQLAGAA